MMDIGGVDADGISRFRHLLQAPKEMYPQLVLIWQCDTQFNLLAT